MCEAYINLHSLSLQVVKSPMALLSLSTPPDLYLKKRRKKQEPEYNTWSLRCMKGLILV